MFAWIWMLLGSVAAFAQTPCEDVAPLVDQAEQAIFQVRFDVAEGLLSRAEKGMACGALADPELLARLWLAEGAMYSFSGDDVGSFHAFQAAIRVAPRMWVSNYGAHLRERYDEAFNTTVGKGFIDFEPQLAFYEGAVDGVVLTEFPAEVSEGLHLVQVRPPSGTVVFGRVVFVDGDSTARVRTGITEIAPPTLAVSPVVVRTETVVPILKPPRKKWHWLIAGATAGAFAGGAALLAFNEKSVIGRAQTAQQVRGAHGRQVGFAVTAYTLAAVSATGITLQFAL